MRTTFTGKQIFELEKSFESKKYLSSAERAEMASNLQVTQQQVIGEFFMDFLILFLRLKSGFKTEELNGRKLKIFQMLKLLL